MNRIFIFLLVTSAITLFYSFGFAKNDDVPEITQGSEALILDEIELYGKTLTRDKAAELFLKLVIPKERLNNEIVINQAFSSPEYKNQYPWLVPHIYPTKGIPRDLVITKRVEPIKIAFGLPPKPEIESNSKKAHLLSISKKSEKLIPDQKMLNEISTFSEEISKVTKLPVKTILPDNENLSDLGNLRIIYVKKDHFYDSIYRNPRGSVEYRTGMPSRIFLNSIYRTHYIKTGFKYADTPKGNPDYKNQVFGYFLANEKNEIEMSFCFIWDGHDFEIERALIKECTVRSLGFPNAGHMDPDSLLGPWNNVKAWYQEKHKVMIDTPPNGLLDGDQYLISLLYNSSMKTGMDYITAYAILAK